jgi:hypothetical protein
MCALHWKIYLALVGLLLLLPSLRTNAQARSDTGLVFKIAIEQAAVVGIDYKRALARASAGNAIALSEIFKATPQMDGGGATFNASKLRELLDLFGDCRFSRILGRQSRKTKEAVTDALDFYFKLNEQRRNWSREYPRTFGLGSHSRSTSNTSR